VNCSGGLRPSAAGAALAFPYCKQLRRPSAAFAPPSLHSLCRNVASLPPLNYNSNLIILNNFKNILNNLKSILACFGLKEEALKIDSAREESNYPHSHPSWGHYPLGHHVTGNSSQTNRPSTTEEQPKAKSQTKNRVCYKHNFFKSQPIWASVGSFDSPGCLDGPFLKAESMFRNREKSFHRENWA
jgi:hypothetical protein